ncbi:glycosyltransferase family 25 protein [Pasteurellaceae bacterium 22721_9_1]
MRKFLISLAKDVQRRELFFSQPDTADFEVFDAVNTMSWSEEQLESYFDIDSFKLAYGRAATKGEIGCTYSHLDVYKLIIEDENIGEDEYALVCEDDALFAANFQQNLTALLHQKPKADIILVGQSKIADFNDKELCINYPTTFKSLQKSIEGTPYRYAYPYKNYFAGTVAYLIKKSACRRFWQEVEQSCSVYWLADDFILFGKRFGLDIVVVRPLMVIENPVLVSNLSSTRAEKKNNLAKKLIKFPMKKVMAIMRNLSCPV